jgi:hypothetical protein
LTVAHYANVVPSATGSFSLNLMLTSGDTSGRINGIRLAVVPEPASLGLIGLGGLGLLARRRRRVPA